MNRFLIIVEKQWQCDKCGKVLCVHRENCLSCGTHNPNFPAKS
jgi:uncharacterized OB-fold protein